MDITEIIVRDYLFFVIVIVFTFYRAILLEVVSVMFTCCVAIQSPYVKHILLFGTKGFGVAKSER